MSEDWVEGRRARAVKEIQIFWKEIQAGRNKFQIRRKEIQIKTPHFLRRIEPFQRLTPTPNRIFSFWSRFPLKCRGRVRRRVFAAGLVVGSFGLRFRFLRPFKQVKGWRRFMIADALSVICPTRRPRSRRARKGEPWRPRAKGPRTREKDRPIDPTSGKNSSAS